ncbi:unnamed protein product [Brassica rapa subsp. narinosa]
MCRPSQTPHLTMSSARIDPPKQVLGTLPPIHGVSKITLKVVVFHLGRSSHLFYTSQMFGEPGSQSSSTGSSFTADSAKPVPLAVVSLDSRQGQWESR